MNSTNSLGIGLYSVTEASRLLRISRGRLDGWVKGYVRPSLDGTRVSAPVVNVTETSTLTFGDLVELMYVREFRSGGVSLQKIRQVADRYTSEWETRYPFATRRFATDGRDLLLQEGGQWIGALNGQTIAFEEMARTLVHLGDFASEWRPLGVGRAVVLDPSRSFGKPIEETSGAHTFLLTEAIRAGDKVSDVAWWYGISESSVLDAIEFEHSFAGARTP